MTRARRAERRAALQSPWRGEEDPHIIEALAQAHIWWHLQSSTKILLGQARIEEDSKGETSTVEDSKA